ncbi:hypothetical protein [Stappia sp. ES.058]|uniref:hypothetical protein n=1 Tax=Stappia sp. ES.058 TaxID=1881061 RepID=UPI00087C3458|nr:hypothetical protein [Stappia sp. ES.058]SDU45358.1 hypothetical protein SAMN05428979_3978 [Stappia sp. ES.058]
MSGRGTANEALNDSLSVSAGDKYLKTDYRKDGHVFDTELGGRPPGRPYDFWTNSF